MIHKIHVHKCELFTITFHICIFYICRPVKIASVQKAVEKVTSSTLEENPVTIDIEHEEEDVKPLILPEQVQTENKADGGP